MDGIIDVQELGKQTLPEQNKVSQKQIVESTMKQHIAQLNLEQEAQR